MEPTFHDTPSVPPQSRLPGWHARSSGPAGAQQSIGIIVPSTGALETLHSCLCSLVPCCINVNAELTVVRAGMTDALQDVMRLHPSVSYLVAAAGTSAPDLRRAGFLHSTRNILAFVDDAMPERQAWSASLCGGWHDWVAKGGRLDIAGCGSVATSPPPAVSVVVPVHNGYAALRRVLDAMMLTDLPREQWELVIVDDASDDDAALVAAEYADRLVRLPGRKHGPGYARNRGFEVTLGRYVTFVNADVMVHPDTLRRAKEALEEDATVTAVCGDYDIESSAPGFISQYRNLLQQFYHRRPADCPSFSSACGMIRSEVFEEVGGYDEWYFAQHQLEDFELGQRLRQLDRRVVRHPEIRSTHLKRWTLRGLMLSEIVHRGVPWMRLVDRLIIPARMAARSVRTTKRRNIILSWLGAAATLAWQRGISESLVVALLCVVAIVANNRAQLAFFRRERGLAFALATIPLDILYYLACGLGVAAGWLARQMLGEPRREAAAEAFSEMSVRRWPPAPVKRVPTLLPMEAKRFAVPVDTAATKVAPSLDPGSPAESEHRPLS